jgi:hypothetical protein
MPLPRRREAYGNDAVRVARVRKHRNARKIWQELLEQLQPFSLLLRHLHRHPGDVPARARKTGNDTNSDGVAGRHDNRYRAGGFVRGETGRCRPRAKRYSKR